MKKFLTALATAGLLIGVLSIPTAQPAKAFLDDVIYVSKSGSLNMAALRSCKNTEYHDIQDAIDDSVDNQTIVICPGIWKLSDPLQTDETTGLVLQGTSTSKTIIDGQKTSEVLDTSNSGGWGSVTLRTLTVQNGRGYWRAPVATGDMTCDRVLFKNNANDDWYWYAFGGALAVYGDATFSQCTFQGNSATNGGGAAYIDGVLTDHQSTYVQNISGTAGALYINDGDSAGSSIVGSTFTKNRAVYGFDVLGTSSGGEGDGGAILYNAEGTLNIASSMFKSNYASNDGGAIGLGDNGDEYDACNDVDINFCEGDTGGTLIVTSSTFISNVANNTDSDNDGGAISHEDSDGYVEVYGSTFQGNSAGGDGGAVYASGYMTISGNRFIGNHSYFGYGGATYAGYDYLSDPNANVWRGNRHTNGVNDWYWD